LIYDEAMIREATDNLVTGISLGGLTTSTVRYADDKSVVATTERATTTNG